MFLVCIQKIRFVRDNLEISKASLNDILEISESIFFHKKPSVKENYMEKYHSLSSTQKVIMKNWKLLLNAEMLKYFRVESIGIPIKWELVPVSLKFPLKLSKWTRTNVV